MKKVQSGWSLALPLEKALRASQLSNAQIAGEAKVNYHAVRRMRRDGVRNRSANAVALCKFFRISESDRVGEMSEAVLISAVVNAWDGTEEHGRLILDLIRCAEQHKVVPKN